MFGVFLSIPCSQTSHNPGRRFQLDPDHTESDRILVLPIWEKHPVVEAGAREPYILSFGNPLFLMVKDLSDLTNILPSKISVAYVSLGAVIGRIIFFNGIIIISEKGTMVTMSCPGNFRNPVASCTIHREVCVDTELKEEFIRLFKESKGEVSYSEKSILSYIKTRPTHIEQPFKITNNSEEKQSIVEFLSGINDKCNTLQFLTETERVLLKAGVDPGNIEILLFKAVVNGDHEAVRALLAGGADINARSNNGITPLTLAAMKGYLDITKILIDSGADLNVRNKDENTALKISIQNGFVEITKLLQNAGAVE